MLAIRKIFGNAARPVGALATVVAFITDVLQPLGNFAPWVAGAAFVTAIVSGIGYYRQWRKPGIDKLEHPLLGLFAVSFALAVLFGAWSIIEDNGPHRGYLAQNIDVIAQIQAQLLGLQGSLPELNRALAGKIAAGEFGLQTPGLSEHLWRTTMDKLAVDQPNYAAYKRELQGKE